MKVIKDEMKREKSTEMEGKEARKRRRKDGRKWSELRGNTGAVDWVMVEGGDGNG